MLACFLAFFLTQRLKHTPTAVQRFELTPRFSPAVPGPAAQERISFKLAQADRVTVTIIDSAGDTVATLVRAWPVARYKQFSLRWNGRRGAPHGYTILHVPSHVLPGGLVSVLPDNRGSLAPAGEYRVRVSLRHQHRTVLSPRSFTLER
ncbi:MAG TPA: hypothetical protein VL972_07920 [Solirubrobacteraceae bacterium]|nr:hypothetical protein [Solirubrobacteraceae bacterium]